jgi:hypothetical protein
MVEGKEHVSQQERIGLCLYKLERGVVMRVTVLVGWWARGFNSPRVLALWRAPPARGQSAKAGPVSASCWRCTRETGGAEKMRADSPGGEMEPPRPGFGYPLPNL